VEHDQTNQSSLRLYAMRMLCRSMLGLHLTHFNEDMQHLYEGSQKGGDVPLVRLQVALQERIEVEEDELVHADDARDEGDHGHACLHLLAAALLQPHKQLLRKCLHAVQVSALASDEVQFQT